MAEKSTSPAIGIDLGTTFSCVGVWRNNRVEIITNDQGNRTTPSYVTFKGTERLIGDAAKNEATRNPTNTVFEGENTIEETSPTPGHTSFTSPLTQNTAIDPVTSGIVGSSGSVSKRQRAKRKQKGVSKRDLQSIALNREKRSVHFKQTAIRGSKRVEKQRTKEIKAGLVTVEQEGGTRRGVRLIVQGSEGTMIDKAQERVSQLDAGGSSSTVPLVGKVKEEVEDWMPEDMDCIDVYKEFPLVIIDAE